jgi:hypothetical protein
MLAHGVIYNTCSRISYTENSGVNYATEGSKLRERSEQVTLSEAKQIPPREAR